jgi:hypothetical protein
MKHIAQSLDEEVGKTYDKPDVKMMVKKYTLRNWRKPDIKISSRQAFVIQH